MDAERGHRGRASVLYVDHPPDVTSAVASTLAGPDVTVTVAHDTAEALEYLTTGTFHCVVAGHSPPVVDGLTLLTAVRAEQPSLPFVLTPVDGSESLASEAVELGVTRYYPRRGPVDATDVYTDRIRAAVERARSGRSDGANARDAKTLLTVSPDAIVVAVDGDIAYANPAAVDLFGADEPVDVTGRPVVSFAAREERSLVADRLDSLQSGESVSSNVERVVVGVDGTESTVEVTGRKITWEGEDAVLLIAHDVTTERRLYEEVTAEGAMLERILQTSPVGITILDTDGNIVEANERAETVLGITRNEILSRRYDSPEWRALDEAGTSIPPSELPFRRVFDTGEPVFGHEHGIELPDGTRRWLSVNAAPVADESGTVDRVVMVIEDVTDDRERSQELERHETMVETVDDGVFIVDDDGRFVDVNEAMCDLTGYRRRRLTAMTLSDLVTHGDDTAAVEDGVDSEHPADLDPAEREWLADDSGTVEMTVRRADGTTVPVETRFSTAGDDRRPEASVTAGVMRDVSDRIEREERLQYQRDQLSLLNSIVRHDIRNDMMVISGWLDLLRDKVPPDIEDRFTDIIHASDHVTQLTFAARDVMEILESDEGFELEPVRLDRELEREVTRIEQHYQHAHVVVDDLPAVAVWANPMLSSVFGNLLTNAVIHHTGDPTIDVDVDVTDEEVVVVVADDGPGIPDHVSADLFTPGSKGLDSDGMGLGLYLVQTLVEGYGGDVRVESNTPTGAVFTIVLNRAPVDDDE